MVKSDSEIVVEILNLTMSGSCPDRAELTISVTYLQFVCSK